jgi:two-component system phosphate regulon response regulator PhoB
MENPGRIFSRSQLLDRVWGAEAFLGEFTINTCIKRLRQALNKGSSSDPIRTVRGSGYGFDENYGKMG